MPTYEFRCPNGHTFDEFHKISDAPQSARCSVCGAEAARAISGGAGLVFKGSGFYLTDYGKNAHRNPAPAAGGEGKSESKSDGGSGGKESGSTGGSGASTPGSSSSGTSSGGGSTPTSGGGSGGGTSSGGTSAGGAA